MIENVVSVPLPVDEFVSIKKNRIKGEGSDKRFCLVTGIHGDELEGQLVCFMVQQKISEHPEFFHGTIDIYPALNPLGIDSITRAIPAFDVDMNTTFPGSYDKTMTEYLAVKVMEELTGADFVIDIHASSIFIREVPQVRIPFKYRESLFPFAKLLNMDLIWAHDSSSVMEGSLAYSLNNIGVPSVVIDMGIGMACTQSYAEQLTDGIFCLLKKLGMWTGDVIEIREPLYSEKQENLIQIEAPHAGLFIKNVECGRHVNKGETIGRVINPLEGTVLFEVESPAEGFLFTLREYPIVDTGTLLGRIII